MKRAVAAFLVVGTLALISAAVLRAGKGDVMVEKSKPAGDDELRRKLTPEQYRVVRECGTEPPFKNAYWDNHAEGLYVDVVSGEPLFTSREKFDSGTGWPSFTAPVEKGNVKEKRDSTFGMERVEVRSKKGDSHLGHVFNDGPGPTGLRYCINSASLRFIPVEKLEAEGYGQYRPLFKKVGAEKQATATFGGGCFWCMQPPFDNTKGVISTSVGYTGGKTKNPTYEEVCSGSTGHVEAVEVVYDPSQVTYEALLEVFWRSVDPTDPGGQFGDRGTQYRTAVFYHDEEQKAKAAESKRKLAASGKFDRPIAVSLEPAAPFYPAEDYHQKYYRKKTAHYNAYKEGSGRAGFLRKTWGEEK